MSLRLHWGCDVDGCDESIVDARLEPYLAQSNTRGTVMFVLDTGWIDGPDGWSIDRDTDRVYCPAHNPEGVAGTVAEDTTELPSGSEGGPR